MAWNVLNLAQWQKYIRAICARSNLTLEWSDDGVTATNGVRMWVAKPAWPMQEQDAALVLSCVIHESSHVKHSDFVAGEAVHKKAPATFQVWNIIEDDRIEYLPCEEWEGDRRAIMRTAGPLVETFIENRVEGIAKMRAAGPLVDPAAVSLQEKLFAVGLWNCEARANSWAPAYSVPGNKGVSAEVLAHVATLEKYPECLKMLADARPVADLSGSRDLIALAEYITKLLGITKDEQDAAKQAEGEGEQGKQGAGADAGNHGGMAQEMGAGKRGAAKDAAEAAASKEEAEGDPSELFKVKRGTGHYEPLDPDEYQVLDARDMVMTTRRSDTGNDARRVKSQATGLETLTGKVRRLLQIASQTLRTYGHKSGKLHGSALHRIAANQPGYSQRVFRREETQLDLDCAVHVLVDASGSMGSSGKISNAIVACETLATCIGNVLGVPVMVSMFSTGSNGTWNDRPKMLITRKFNERMVHPDVMLDRLSVAASHLGSNNNDAESVIWAIDELRQQRAKRKFLIVLSDGMPSAAVSGDIHKYLKETIEAAEALPGMEVHGIGIQSDAVRQFYKNCTVLHSPSEIGECIVQLIADRMLRS